jgi:hypothetical protein
MNGQQEDEPIDQSKIEVEFLNELIGDNIIIIIHQNGITIMMDEGLEERSVEQMKTFTRMYMVTEPSFVLTLFLYIEMGMWHLWFWLERLFKKS